ncbi:PTS mannitol transporter subunit IIA [Serratia proteamaculans]|uniref:PTS mannitol transporter subunit IIA n=1 Tax=Serratia proteamaculans TaxID=28151 RepID=UPI00217C0D37|nr:PTS mannitol transporter subunit IIA [Serratia proteamaculans]CAI1533662.1 Mannitol-specific cryptic phosphotransferase enzyme IIA component [Serratia proteamaculans]
MKLIDYFPDKSISIKDNAKDWQQAVDYSMAALLEKGYVTYRYIDEIKKSTLENGPYYILAPLVAMPHARPECGAIKTGLSLTLLKNVVTFGDDKEPVKLLIGLSAADSDEHIGAIQALSEIFCEESQIEALLNATTERQLMDIIAHG